MIVQIALANDAMARNPISRNGRCPKLVEEFQCSVDDSRLRVASGHDNIVSCCLA
jgi:hypothetical protein